MNYKPILLSVLILCMAAAANAQDLNKYERRTYISQADTLPYRILFPEDFNPAKQYPLLFFLHGIGERGNDNEAQLIHGANLFLQKSIRANYQAIVVFPQCPNSSNWYNYFSSDDASQIEPLSPYKDRPSTAMALLLGLTNQLRSKPFVDTNRIYIGGLSSGGTGTYEILRRKPRLFAAAFVICGSDNLKNIAAYQHIPLWIFHGAKDNVTPPKYPISIVNALRDKGADVKFTLYPNANHNSWDRAFANPELIPWLFSHKK